MAEERRYQEEEVREIFDRAARSDGVGPHLPGQGGRTLEELQATGLEVGLAPEQVAEATAAISARRGVLPRALVELPRWARRREGQMEYLADRLKAAIEEARETEAA